MAKIKKFGTIVWVSVEKRIQSLLWRSGMMFVAILMDVALINLEVLELDGRLVVLLGLVLGEVSKQIHNQLSRK